MWIQFEMIQSRQKYQLKTKFGIDMYVCFIQILLYEDYIEFK